MAIEKDIAIHDISGIENCINYITDDIKTAIQNAGIDIENAGEEELKVFIQAFNQVHNTLEYAQNSDKTSLVLDGDEELLVSGYKCNPKTAKEQFFMDRINYARHKDTPVVYGTKKKTISGNIKKDKSTEEIAALENETVEKQEILAHHIIQSFPAIEGLSPKLVHHIGLEMCKRAFPNHKCVVSTHMNTDHLHNHIVMCAYNDDSIGKFHMNIASRNEIRKINDDISLEYGLPILLDSQTEHKSLTWFEWNERHTGKTDLWKNKIKEDIDFIKSKSSSWEEFVKKMRAGGYEVTEGKYVTYRMPGSTVRKIRDNRLGKGYTRKEIMHDFGEEYKPGVKTENQFEFEEKNNDRLKSGKGEPAKQAGYKLKVSFRVSRYTDTGRRRSDLEIVFLKAIKIIRYFMDKYFNKDMENAKSDNPVYKRADVKIRAMEQALYMSKQLGIETIGELKNKISSTGAELNHVKHEVADLESGIYFEQDILEQISILKKLEQEPDIIRFKSKLDNSNWFIREYTDEDIRRNKAAAMPMSSKQRNQLFLELEKSNMRLKYDFSCITYDDAKEVIDYMKGKRHVRPDILMDKAEIDDVKLNKKYSAIRKKSSENLKNSMSGRGISPALEKAVGKIIADNPDDFRGNAIDVNVLSMYDALSIVNYYSENKYKGEFITDSTQEYIQSLLDKTGFKINRSLKYVLKSESSQLINYLNSKKGNIPDLLKSSGQLRFSTEKQIKELLHLKSESISIPLKELSQIDADNLYRYLLNKDIKPDILKSEKSLDDQFIEVIKPLPVKERHNLVQYREIQEYLKAHGIDVNDTDSVADRLRLHQLAYNAGIEAFDNLRKDYRELAKLEYAYNLANNRAFTHGSLYKASELKTEESIEENASDEIKREDEFIQKNIEEENKKREKTNEKRREFFNDIADSLFDRL